MRPIPKSLLIHTVTLHKKINKDKWGKGRTGSGNGADLCQVGSIRENRSGQEQCRDPTFRHAFL